MYMYIYVYTFTYLLYFIEKWVMFKALTVL